MSSRQRLTLSSIILTHMTMKTVMVSNHTRADYEYDYVQINRLSEDVIARYSSSLIQRFKVRGETPEECEEWIVRTYVALKYLLGASVLLSSAQFAIRTNLRIVQPYLLYYALFNSSRALMLVTPEHLWKDGKILDETTHAKTQAVTHDTLRYLSPDVAARYFDINRRVIAGRELLSYKFPAEGLNGALASIVSDIEAVVSICHFIAEMAELHSECLQTAFRSSIVKASGNREAILSRAYLYEHKSLDNTIRDANDYMRFRQYLRGTDRPLSLHLTASPGAVEDFFGQWCPKDEPETPIQAAPRKIVQYDPDDHDWRIIFDFP
jgi:hypothetical protein